MLVRSMFGDREAGRSARPDGAPREPVTRPALLELPRGFTRGPREARRRFEGLDLSIASGRNRRRCRSLRKRPEGARRPDPRAPSALRREQMLLGGTDASSWSIARMRESGVAFVPEDSPGDGGRAWHVGAREPRRSAQAGATGSAPPWTGRPSSPPCAGRSTTWASPFRGSIRPHRRTLRRQPPAHGDRAGDGPPAPGRRRPLPHPRPGRQQRRLGARAAPAGPGRGQRGCS